MSTIYTHSINTPFGELVAGATTKGICMLEFADTERVAMQLAYLKKSFTVSAKPGDNIYFNKLNQELNAYFKGELKKFTSPLDIQGSPFQIQAWKALLTIPYGETRSYQEQAQAISKPKAYRAVATANRNNRISILIPCHRVIAKNGDLAGYGGGLERKAFLIQHEKKHK